jgi:hypothetical protein
MARTVASFGMGHSGNEKSRPEAAQRGRQVAVGSEEQFELGVLNDVVALPHRSEIKEAEAGFLLLWVGEIKGGAGANVIQMDFATEALVPRHSLSELPLDVSLQIVIGTSKQRDGPVGFARTEFCLPQRHMNAAPDLNLKVKRWLAEIALLSLLKILRSVAFRPCSSAGAPLLEVAGSIPSRNYILPLSAGFLALIVETSDANRSPFSGRGLSIPPTLALALGLTLLVCGLLRAVLKSSVIVGSPPLESSFSLLWGEVLPVASFYASED